MDDYLDSFSNKEEAINVSNKAKQLLSNRGFNLTKFSSNNHDILKSLLSTNTVKSTDINLDLDEMPMEQALEVLWQPEKDILKIKSIKKKLPTNKREILSFISTIFDPLGFVTPAVLEPKLIMQELWKRNIEWDEDVPNDLAQRWSTWQATLPNLNKIEIPRWYHTNLSAEESIELYVFVDASSVAYGAV